MAMQLFISPYVPKTSAAGIVNFTAAGGSGTGYTWSLTTNQSGGSIVAGTGVYTAGSLLGTTDTVTVTDSLGATATRNVRVLATATLSSMRVDAQSRADMVNSTFITTAEWNRFINNAYTDLYDLLTQKYQDTYFAQPPYQFTFDGTSQFITLPPDFYKLLGIDLAVALPDWWVTLQTFPFAERNRFALRNFQSFYGLSNLRYRLIGNQLMFTPIPAAGQTARAWYIPRITPLVLDTDTIEDISGWDQFVVVSAVIDALGKEESDTTLWERELATIKTRLEAAAENRDPGSPQTVSDTQAANPWSPWAGPTDGMGGLG